MPKRKKEEEYLKKDEILTLIQNNIRSIQMRDNSTDSGIPQLYSLMKQIEKIKGKTPSDFIEEVSKENDNDVCSCFERTRVPKTLYNRYTGQPESTVYEEIGICNGTREREYTKCEGNKKSEFCFYCERKGKA